jgi:hypothetical protein
MTYLCITLHNITTTIFRKDLIRKLGVHIRPGRLFTYICLSNSQNQACLIFIDKYILITLHNITTTIFRKDLIRKLGVYISLGFRPGLLFTYIRLSCLVAAFSSFFLCFFPFEGMTTPHADMADMLLHTIHTVYHHGTVLDFTNL